MDSNILHYEFVTGEVVSVTVSADIAKVISDSRRIEHANNERTRYHMAYSLDETDYESSDFISEETPDDLVVEQEERNHRMDCIDHLSASQRKRILMLAEGMNIAEIARSEGISYQRAKVSIEAARKKIKKKFYKTRLILALIFC